MNSTDTTPSTFDLERYLDNSKKVDLSDLDFSKVKDYPLSSDEVRCLSFMMDIEFHTLYFLRGLLKTCAVRDPETVAFVSCWNYEEFFHGRAIRQFLRAAGFEVPGSRILEVDRRRSWREALEETAASVLCHIVKDFHAVYFAWGSIQELTTLESYGLIANRTRNPILSELLLRLAKDERRHFSFYYNKARPLLLHSRSAQAVTRTILRHFWTPVGDGVKPDPDVLWTMRFVFGDVEGMRAARRIDSVVSRLPGQGWFNLVSNHKSLTEQAPAEESVPTPC
jgi:hypothetical protein